MLQDRFCMSERRACRIVGQHRSTQRREVTRGKGDEALRKRLHTFSREHKRWGFRMAHSVLRDEGWGANRKKIQRLWREESLKVPQATRKRQRLGSSTCPADRLRAEHPDHVWALDFQFDQTSDGKILKVLNIVDEHTREELGGLVERRIDADRTVAVLEATVTKRGAAPSFIRCDNGPELTANALRDWCRFSGTGTSYIEPGAPWENPFVESFGSRLRYELLSAEQFDTLFESQVMVGDWKHEYNHYRPHSSLGGRSPVAYAASWRAENQLDRLSNEVDL